MPLVLPRVPLRALAEGGRFFYLDRLEQYWLGRQDDGKSYDWEGRFRASGIAALAQYSPLAPGYYVSYSERRPAVRYNLARTVVSRLTQMAVGGGAWPEINVEGDEAAEAALREWCKRMSLPQKLAEARNLGGASGTAVVSLGIVGGEFRVDVHNPKHVLVTAWRERASFRVGAALKAYSYTADEYDREKKRVVTKTYWYVRAWDDALETVWDAIPDELAQTGDWQAMAPSFSGAHRLGFCPVFWAQNLPDSQEVDGEGDYEGQEEKFDEINRLLSATTRGAIANVDPTLVVRDEDDEEPGPMTKGSGAVIYSKGGAEYLELQGTAITAARELLDELRQTVLEECQTVLPREDKITGAAQSAAAMRILYAPMLARCNQLRDQYGALIVQILTALLEAARGRREPIAVTGVDGVIEMVREVIVPDLDPGDSSLVTLRWPEYFQPTQQDIKDTVTTAQTASGGKPVISRRTAVDYVARLFGVTDPDEEIAQIEADSDAEAERMAEVMDAGGGFKPAGAKGKPASDEDDAE